MNKPKLIGDVRDLLSKAFSGSVAAAAPVISDRLFNASSKLMERDRRQVLAARDLFMQRFADWQRLMREEYHRRFDEKIAGKSGSFSNTVAFSLDSLTLMDETEVQETILLGNLSTQLKEACSMELFALTRRLEFLADRELLSDNDNPLLPRVLCRSMLSALDALDAPPGTRYHILSAVEPSLTNILQACYKDANTFLANNAVLVDVAQSYGRAIRKEASKPARGAPPPTPAAVAADAGGSKETASAVDMLTRLLSQNGGAAATPSPASGPAASGASAPTPVASSAPAAKLAPLDPQLLDAISQLSALRAIDTGAAKAPAADAVPDNFLRYSRNLLAPALQPAQGIITDVVTEFFDRVFAAPEISPAIKDLIGRLQVPMLKASMENPALFTDQSHPLRALMDKLAELGVKRRNTLTKGDPTYEQLSAVVNSVSEHYDSDPDTISNANIELDVLIETEEARATEAAEESVAKLQKSENEEMARTLAAYDVAKRLEAGQYPLAIRSFASKYWQPLLIIDHMTQGEDSEQRQLDLATLDDLLWSVSPVSNEEKPRLLKLLPQIAGRLGDGLDRAGIGETERGPFFEYLADLHRLAMRPTAAPPATRQATAEAATAQVPAAVDPRTRLRKRTVDIERGQWIELVVAGNKTQRCQLSWISPLLETLVFKNYDTNQALTLSPNEYSEKLRTGAIKRVEDTALMQRCIDSAVKKTTPAGQAAPAGKTLSPAR